MAFRVRWSEQAGEDLKELVKFLSQYDPEIARSLAGRIVDRLDAAAAYPLSARVVPEKEDPLLARVAPEQCLFYTTWSGMATPDADSGNRTERFCGVADHGETCRSCFKTPSASP